MLAKRLMETCSKDQGENVDTNLNLRMAKRNNRRKGSRRNKLNLSEFQFGGIGNPIKKGSTVSRLDSLFHDGNAFFIKFERYCSEKGQKLKESHKLEDELVSYELAFGKHLVKVQSTNLKKVHFINKGQEKCTFEYFDRNPER